MSHDLDPHARRTRANATIDRGLELLLAKDMAGFADLWAPSGSMELPFAPPGYPSRLDGRKAITAYLADYTDVLDVRAIISQTRHQTLTRIP
jgi:ketosteroid isomerase-like protein